MLAALCRELELRSEYLAGQTVKTVYLGGGTPSLLDAQELETLFSTVHRLFPVAEEAEITLEANPDDLSAAKLAELKTLGVNRLSIGIQSFREADLQWMNRAHNAMQATESVQLAQAAGFSNITIDLIYGLPNLSPEAWAENLHRAIALNVPHISAYCLTVEEGTALAHFVQQGTAKPVNETAAAQQFDVLVQRLATAGLVQYEISNFGREGYFSQHNSSYWKGAHYLGIGPSAHSFNGVSRQWNVANNVRYIKGLESGNLPAELEALSPETRYNEYVLTGLRTIWGCDAEHISATFGDALRAHFERETAPWLASQDLLRSAHHYVLSPSGKLLADRIASDLMYTADE